uniref:Uncharacterized protein n=1 Tax=Octopus bimaculoides TaxID=37653 RepID=A0A0L8ICL5_OCTBM
MVLIPTFQFLTPTLMLLVQVDHFLVFQLELLFWHYPVITFSLVSEIIPEQNEIR